MCLVSGKIKFCTCVSGSYDELPHYWLLYRFNKKKDLYCIGEPIFPYGFLQPQYELNKNTLANRLNEPDAFDKKIEFKENDQLEVVINNLSDDFRKRMVFCFTYKEGKWMEEEHDVFELMNHYDELAFGKFDQLENK